MHTKHEPASVICFTACDVDILGCGYTCQYLSAVRLHNKYFISLQVKIQAAPTPKHSSQVNRQVASMLIFSYQIIR